MIAICVSRNAGASVLAAALLAACGESQPPFGAAGSMPQRSQILTATAHRRDLLYVSSNVATNVYTYPHGKLISALGGTTGLICSNAAGDVFLSPVNVDVVDQFQHGRSTPIAEISFSGQSCSTDRTSGKLTIASFGGGSVGIFRPAKRHHWHLPRLYSLPGYLVSC